MTTVPKPYSPRQVAPKQPSTLKPPPWLQEALARGQEVVHHTRQQLASQRLRLVPPVITEQMRGLSLATAAAERGITLPSVGGAQ